MCRPSTILQDGVPILLFFTSRSFRIGHRGPKRTISGTAPSNIHPGARSLSRGPEVSLTPGWMLWHTDQCMLRAWSANANWPGPSGARCH